MRHEPSVAAHRLVHVVERVGGTPDIGTGGLNGHYSVRVLSAACQGGRADVFLDPWSGQAPPASSATATAARHPHVIDGRGGQTRILVAGGCDADTARRRHSAGTA